MEMVLEQFWRDGRKRGVSRATIETNVPRKTLLACPWVRHRLCHIPITQACGPSGAAQLLRTAIRTIRFIEATGAVPSKARGLFPHPWADNRPVGLDHTLVWRDRDGVLFMTTEPYHDPATGVVDRFNPGGIAVVRLPEGAGMWNPPATTLFLLARPEHHTNLVRLHDDLLAFRMPPEPVLYVETTGIPHAGTSNTHADTA